ncbi:MAG: D-alanyl-D-alanine carboxypeptidase/D-alanyl-D-alanine-endopeptidase [Pseudomonadota bacterium]
MLLLTIPVACASLTTQIETNLYANPDQTGIRWGLVVADISGEELVALKPDDRFTPASNAKIATSMAGFQWLETLETDTLAPGLTAYLEEGENSEIPDLVLFGGGDALIGDGPNCAAYCLATLADQIVAAGATEIGDIVGDDSLFPNERWNPGWSQEDLQYPYGTAVSALTVNNNVVGLSVDPAESTSAPARVTWNEGDEFYRIINETMTVGAELPYEIRIERAPGSDTVRVYGTVPNDSASVTYSLGIDNPALYAATRLKRLLEARGINVLGEARSRHRPLNLADFPADEADNGDGAFKLETTNRFTRTETPLAALPPTPLTESLLRVSRDSQNLHAELLLRRLGLIDGTGSTDHGIAKIETLWSAAGVPNTGYAIHGGSGLSIYNRMTPRSMVRLLSYATTQPWFEEWKSTLPVAGISGTLQGNFKGTILEGNLFAKTGTLNGVNALSGYMITASGRELVFSIIANDRPARTPSALLERDAALLEIAAAY